MKIVLAVCAVSFALMTSAQAQQGPWSGFYWGVNGGYGWSEDFSTEGANNAGFPLQSLGERELDGGFGGFQGGFNWQTRSLVLGVETDFQWAGFKGSLGPTSFSRQGISATAADEVNYFGSIRGRIGLADGPVLVYVTGGLAYADVDYELFLVDRARNNVTFRSDSKRIGYVVGVGAEWTFAPSWSAKLEYQHLDLGDQSNTASVLNASGVPNGVTVTTADLVEFQTVRIGLNYKFGERDGHQAETK